MLNNVAALKLKNNYMLTHHCPGYDYSLTHSLNAKQNVESSSSEEKLRRTSPLAI
jgi:hypothetical protein